MALWKFPQSDLREQELNINLSSFINVKKTIEFHLNLPVIMLDSYINKIENIFLYFAKFETEV